MNNDLFSLLFIACVEVVLRDAGVLLSGLLC
jgi:hypothetical protein